jgi:type IV secretory pathway TraG/TraD family ATPase VirD4
MNLAREGFFMGRSLQSGRDLYAKTERHGMVTSGTGGGKTTMSLFDKIVRFPGSVVVIGDVMGELACLTAAYRSTMSDVILNKSLRLVSLTILDATGMAVTIRWRTKTLRARPSSAR